LGSRTRGGVGVKNKNVKIWCTNFEEILAFLFNRAENLKFFGGEIIFVLIKWRHDIGLLGKSPLNEELTSSTKIHDDDDDTTRKFKMRRKKSWKIRRLKFNFTTKKKKSKKNKTQPNKPPRPRARCGWCVRLHCDVIIIPTPNQISKTNKEEEKEGNNENYYDNDVTIRWRHNKMTL